MSKARTSPVRTALVHATLIFYMLIAVFPVALTLINSFKSRNAIFREPLRFPTPESFSLIGYETVLKQGSFLTYFQNSAIVTVVSIFSSSCLARWRPSRSPNIVSAAIC